MQGRPSKIYHNCRDQKYHIMANVEEIAGI